MKEYTAIQLVLKEHKETANRNPRFNSAHEGFAILKEEVDELWDEVKRDSTCERKADEAKQVAAMAIRFLTDCC